MSAVMSSKLTAAATRRARLLRRVSLHSTRLITVAQPSPAFLHVARGHEHLVESLRTAFLVDQRSVPFGERGGGQHNVGLRGRRGLS